MEDYVCKCGMEFSGMEFLQAHWDDPNKSPDKPHYRAGKSGEPTIDQEEKRPPGLRY